MNLIADESTRDRTSYFAIDSSTIATITTSTFNFSPVTPNISSITIESATETVISVDNSLTFSELHATSLTSVEESQIFSAGASESIMNISTSQLLATQTVSPTPLFELSQSDFSQSISINYKSSIHETISHPMFNESSVDVTKDIDDSSILFHSLAETVSINIASTIMSEG